MPSQLQIPRQQIQLLIDALPVASLALNGSGYIQFVNAALLELFGYRDSELIGQPVSELVPFELRERHHEFHAAYLKDATRRSMGSGLNIFGVTHDGERLPLNIGLSPVHTQDGTLILATVHDLRGIKQTEAERDALRADLEAELEGMRQLHALVIRLAERSDLAALLDEILAAVIALQHADFGNIQILDAEGKWLTIAAQKHFQSPFLEHFARISAAEGTSCGRALRTKKRVIIPDVTLDADYAPHRAAAAAAGYRAVQSTPILPRNGAVKGMLSTYFRHPHTPSKRVLRLTDLCLHLGASLIERAQATAALAAAHKAADEASAAKTRFLAAAGHDLRQPLQTIGLLKSVLERQVMNPPAFTTLAKLGDAIRHMQDLVESMLDTSQIESGTLPVNLTDIQLDSFLANLVGDFAPIAAAKGVVLRYVPCSATIQGDRRMLTRIIDNLLSNALKYTDKGKILLGCRRRGTMLRVEIWDTGPGIEPALTQRIFGEFTRGCPADDKRPGLGLGLHIVERFSARLGYKTDICSAPGRGSMFALLIPHPRYAGATDNAGAPTNGQMPWVLLVGDDPAQRDALQTLLQLEAYHVQVLRDATMSPEEITALPTEVPLVIVTDQDLSGDRNGAAIVRDIRTELRRKLPAIILSGRALEAASLAAAGSEIQFLVKPVQPARLLGAIEHALSRLAPGWRTDDAAQRRPLLPALQANALGEADIAVIDDEASICDAVRDVLVPGGYGVETYGSAEAFLAASARARFRCVIVDISLPGMSGMALHAVLRAEPEPPQIIFLTGSSDLSLAVQALRNGAADFLHKPVDGLRLLQSVTMALHRRNTARDAVSSDFVTRRASLTPREREVMERVVRGELNKNIAADLGISERTTEHHRQSVMRKMGAKSLAALVRLVQ